MKRRAALAVAVLMAVIAPRVARADTVLVAVAANFSAVAEELAPLFTAATGHEVRHSFGATGQLFTQITQGAPFEVFLSADAERPARAVADGLAVEGTVFTYAVGRLALYGLDAADAEGVLAAGQVHHLAIADPETAPYGRAAVETLAALGLTELYAGKLVTGESITQALQFVESGSAELGFVAASQVHGKAGAWMVPPDLHRPIRQDAVLLAAGADNPAARAYLEFLRSDAAVAVITAAGYAVE